MDEVGYEVVLGDVLEAEATDICRREVKLHGQRAFLAVFVALKTAHRAGGYAVWPWIPRVCDLRRSDYHLGQLKNSV